MNVKKFIAASNREALKQVKEQLGPDAIILSNRTVSEGVEIMAIAAQEMAMMVPESKGREPAAAPRHDDPLVNRQRPQPYAETEEDGGDYRLSLSSRANMKQPAMAMPRNSHLNSPFGPATMPSASKQGGTLGDLIREGRKDELAAWAAKHSSAQAAPAATPSKPVAKKMRHALPVAETIETRPEYLLDERSVAPPVAAPAEVVPAAVMEEIRMLRRMVEQNLAGIAWGESARQAPARTEVLRHMLDVGFSPRYARELTDRLPAELDYNLALKWVQVQLEEGIDTLSAEGDIVDRGGFYALVGPTGVGKTTTTAKLAARCVLKHGPSKVALVTTDSYRIGAYEQLRIYGRILGVPVYMAKDAAELRQILMELKYKHMVLIDTMGMSQKDKMVDEHNAMLDENRVQRLLVMSATSRGDTLDEIVTAYQSKALAGCVLSKVDEAASLASALDAIARHHLRLSYVSNGQRVPEDLHLPNKGYLIHRALKDSSDQETYRLDGMEPALMMASAGGGKRG